MNRKINISKYQGNTVYSVSVTDSYGTEHHLGYWKHFDYIEDIEKQAEEIWANEVKPKEDLMAKAIANCIELDKKNGLLKGNRDGLD
tara:strand:- start:589 stop:849 length:261 start_codon:yes stop_codon:yes gene_type:complete